MPPTFQPFDPDAELEITSRNLPHWNQAGATCFITFRTADSLPNKAVGTWRRTRAEWLRRHGVDPESISWKEAFARLPVDVRKDFHREFNEHFQQMLDVGYGECLLKQPRLAKIVGDSLRHFDGERYHLSDFVVMPNHVHVLAQFEPGTAARDQCASWKRYSAAQINRLIGRRGAFWQDENFDHLVRSSEHFEQLRRYIAENPRKARLQSGEYLLYQFDRVQ